jgi:hypothetical protein
VRTAVQASGTAPNESIDLGSGRFEEPWERPSVAMVPSKIAV